MKGLFIQMTGLSGSGKTTLANKTAEKLKKDGYKVEIIDGDEYRLGLCSDLGFTREDRNTNIRRLGFVGRVLARNGVIAIMSAINPYEEIRNEIEGELVFVNCKIETAIDRDVKGLYAKALSGEIKNFTGISDPFEIPQKPATTITTDNEDLEFSADKLYNFILSRIK